MQSSTPHILTLSTPSSVPIQTINSPKKQVPIVDLEDSDEEQGLQSNVLNLLVNSATNAEQLTASTSTPKVAPVIVDISKQPNEGPTKQLNAE